MKPVKYFLLARTIKLFTQFAFLFTVFAIIFNLIIGIFDLKPSVELSGWTFGHRTKGYNVSAGLSLQIPDTIIQTKNGYNDIYADDPAVSDYKSQQDTVRLKIVNQIKSNEDEDIRISNSIYLNGPVTTRVNSENWKYNLFWNITAQINLVFSALISLIVIKLCNRYMDEEIFERRTFKLIAFLGWIFVIQEISNFVIRYINGFILEHPQLHSFSVVGPKVASYLRLHLDYYSMLDYGTLFTGMLIVMLAEVFKVAILAKKENEMTI